MARTRIQDLLDRQGESLAALEDRQVRAVLRAYDDARRELREELERMVLAGVDRKTPFTAQHLRVMLAQAEAGSVRLQRRLGEVMTPAIEAQRRRALGDLLAVVGRQEKEFTEVGGRIELRALQRLVEQDGLLLHQHSLERYGRDLVSQIQRELVVGVTRGQTLDQVVARIVSADESVFSGMRHRAELIARMEMSGAYNEGHHAALEEAGSVLDADGAHEGDPLMARADEFLDRRNHPFSRALDGLTRPINGTWQVPAAAVEAAAAALKKPAKGILWERRGAFWVGNRYPAHYNDRGRQVSWRASWGDSADATAPPPERKTYTGTARTGRPQQPPTPDEEPVVVRAATPRTGGRAIPPPKP